MTVIVKRGTVFDGEREYKVGDVIPGLSQEDEARLVKSGVAVWPRNEESAGDEDEDEQTGAEDGPQTELPLTLDEFKGLSAAEQKEHLKLLNIDPGSNENERLEQYGAWYGQAAGDAV